MKALSITYEQYDTAQDLRKDIQSLALKAQEAAEKAYAPYSKFHVGCAISLENGTIVTGNNQENVAYPSGLCAERVAIFSASATLPGEKIKSIFIRAFSKKFMVNQPISPCGSCRQVLLEYQMLQKDQPIPIYMQGASGPILMINDIRDLLPFCFFEEKLNEGEMIKAEENSPLTL